MKSQRNQVIALVLLLIIWAVSWRLMRAPAAPPSVIKTTAAKASSQQDNLLRNRFHRIRSEMDGLYHYRIKPAPFDASGNPFRINGMITGGDSGVPSRNLTPNTVVVAPGQTPGPEPVLETGTTLLKHAIEATRFGGVVTLGDTTELTVDGQLHKEGEVFTTKVKARLVLIRIKHLTTSSVTLALDDPDAGNAEMRVRLK